MGQSNAFLSGGNHPDISGRPKAFLNWILVDEQFKYVSGDAEPVRAESDYNNGSIPNNNVYQHVQRDLPVAKNGFLYIFVSNESTNTPVFFDNLRVKHTKGALLEETHYYPFGLVMSGISSKAAGGIENKYKYNGKELQSHEFVDGSSLEWEDYGARIFDSQLGRFWQIDPNSKNCLDYTPYNYVLDNPIVSIDPDGKDAILVVYPDYKIAAMGTKWSNLGHAGVLIIDNKTGVTKYFEYGRYDSASKGIVRTVKTSKVVIGKDGKPTVESLNKVLAELSKSSGQGGRIRGAYVISDKYKEMLAYAESKMAENNDPDRKEYSLTDNSCGTFARDVFAQDDDLDNPKIINPTPINIVSEYIDEGNAEIFYDPKSTEINKTTVGKGDETDAKLPKASAAGDLLKSMGKFPMHPGSAGPANKKQKKIIKN